MTRHVVEIASDRRILRLERGFLVIEEEETENAAKVPLDDIQALLVSAPAATLSTRVIAALSERGAPIVISATNYMPVSIVLPLNGHGDTAGVQSDQIAASAAHRKRLWQKIVRAKIRGQAWSLRVSSGVRSEREGAARHLDAMVSRVGSGDPTNLEAQAARAYWTVLMGAGFRRDPSAGGRNAALNYGYAVLRACVARAVVASGLNPAIGIFHANRHNPLCLVDDLMEPFRPLVDRLVAGMPEDVVLTADEKRILSRVLDLDLRADHGLSPVRQCALSLAQSVAAGFRNGQPEPNLAAYPDPSEPELL